MRRSNERRVALYDHPASKKAAGQEEKPKAEDGGGEKQDVKDREDEAAKTGEADVEKEVSKTAEKVADGDITAKEIAANDGLSQDTKQKFIEALRSLHKTHETERRDFHGNMREAMRQMSGRHEKAIKDLMDSHMSGGEAEAQPEE